MLKRRYGMRLISTVLAKITFVNPRKRGEKSRQVLQEIKVLKYTLSSKSKHLIEVTLVHKKEQNSPKEQGSALNM